jgi:sugar fermentation stimulation protein A
MRFPTPLIPGTLIRRYKRFLADVALDDGAEVTVHCPNPGAMLGLANPGMRVWLEPNDDPRKKLNYGWRLAALPAGHLAVIDTGIANRVVAEALNTRAIPALAAYGSVHAEVKYGQNSRCDFLLCEPGLPDCWVEVKSVTLRRTTDWAEFPDCVTKRGAKHLGDLAARVAAGDRAKMLYVVQRTDCARFRLADDLDPEYAAAFRAARDAGVGAMAVGALMDCDGVALGADIPLAPELE